MDITFLVGNGFDIAAGLKTSYKDFYNWYCEQNENDSACIQKFKNEIMSNLDIWADFEVALGNYTDKFAMLDMDDFWECYEDSLSKLQDYIEIQVNEFVATISKTELVRFSESLAKFYSELSPQEVSKFNSFMPPNPKLQEAISVHFISFNYTNVLDKIIKEVSASPIEVWSAGNSTYGMRVDPAILHVHGRLNNGVLIGVDNKNQIRNRFLRDDIEAQEYLIKQQASKAMGELVQDQAEKLLQSSKVICLWGLSIGDTDARWWELIMNIISNDPSRHIIIYWYTNGTTTRKSHRAFRKKQKEIQQKLTDHSALTKQELKEVQERIHIVFDTEHVLKVRLHQKEKVTVASGI